MFSLDCLVLLCPKISELLTTGKVNSSICFGHPALSMQKMDAGYTMKTNHYFQRPCLLREGIQKKIDLFQEIVPNSGPHPPTPTVQDSHSGRKKKKERKSPKIINSKKYLGNQSIQKWPDMTSSLFVIYVSRHYWMFAVQITGCVFSLKSLGLLTPTHPQFRTFS